MKDFNLFPRMALPVLLGAFLAVLLAGPFGQTQAADPSDKTQTTSPSGEVQLVVEKDKNQPSNQPAQESPGKKPPCGPAGCNAANVTAAHEQGCTSGNYCINNSVCSMGMTCQTINNGGTCFCTCSR